MSKILSLIVFLLISFKGEAVSLDITWFGTSNIALSDGKTTILFDPFFTRPSLFKVATSFPLESNREEVLNWLTRIKYKKIKGILVSHTHYDHILDLQLVQDLTKATVYGSQSAMNVGKGHKIENKYLRLLKPNHTVSIGPFRITPLESVHASHFLGLTFADGKIEKPLKPKSSAYDYKTGVTYNFLVEYKGKRILFYPGSLANYKHKNIDLLIQGVSSLVKLKEIKKNNIDDAKIIIPVHHDDFFKELSEGFSLLSFSPYDDFKKLLKNKKLVELEFGKTVKLNLP